MLSVVVITENKKKKSREKVFLLPPISALHYPCLFFSHSDASVQGSVSFLYICIRLQILCISGCFFVPSCSRPLITGINVHPCFNLHFRFLCVFRWVWMWKAFACSIIKFLFQYINFEKLTKKKENNLFYCSKFIWRRCWAEEFLEKKTEEDMVIGWN